MKGDDGELSEISLDNVDVEVNDFQITERVQNGPSLRAET